jgi:hypothetical protein
MVDSVHIQYSGSEYLFGYAGEEIPRGQDLFSLVVFLQKLLVSAIVLHR